MDIKSQLNKLVQRNVWPSEIRFILHCQVCESICNPDEYFSIQNELKPKVQKEKITLSLFSTKRAIAIDGIKKSVLDFDGLDDWIQTELNRIQSEY
jgi:hypothetical protein